MKLGATTLRVLIAAVLALVGLAAGAGAAKASAVSAFHTPRWAAQCFVDGKRDRQT
jgi:hypothetical protein